MAKLCPVCHDAMKRIYGSNDKTLAVDIDTCPKCGGFWFDNQELFLISADTAKKYDAEVSQSKNIESAAGTTKNRICPNCHLTLVLLKDPELSKILQVDICPKCLGIWLDQGEFLRYKEFQREKIEKAKKADAVKAVEALRELGENQKADGFWNFLMKDVSRSIDSTDQAGNFASNIESVIMWLIKVILGRSGFRI